MGEDPASTVEEIQVLRGRLDEELSELDRRLPGPATLAWRVKLAAAGGAVAIAALWLAVRRIRRRAVAGKVEAVVELLPDDVADRLAAKLAGVLDDHSGRYSSPAATAMAVVATLVELAYLVRLERNLGERMR